MAVADTNDPHTGHAAFLEAARDLGFSADPKWDFNGAQQENGAGFYQKNLRNGRRHSAAAGFLTPILGRPNLTVKPHSQVRRLLFTGNRVTGVEYLRGGGGPGAAATVDTFEHGPARQQLLDDGCTVGRQSENYLVAGQGADPAIAYETLPAASGLVLDDDFSSVTCDYQPAAFDTGHPATIPG